MAAAKGKTERQDMPLRRLGWVRRAEQAFFRPALLAVALGLTWPSLGSEADLDRGEAVFKAECAGCHGPEAWGGRDGQYPRLAGLPTGYLQRQLEAFRDRKRQNKPMIPVFKSGRLRGDDIAAVATHLAALPPPAPELFGGSEEPNYDRERGAALYVAGCSSCHGVDGNGTPDTDNPPVTRQHPVYLVKQLRDFRAGERWHEDAEPLFQKAEPEDLDALLGYMLDLNDGVPGTAPN